MMKNRVEELKDSASGYARIWQDFVKSYDNYPDYLYCFFEGADDVHYYGIRIDNIVFHNITGERRWFCSKGKDNVIRLYELISQDDRYKHAWLAFFIDKDFDELSELPVTDVMYITECYSIENFYVTEDAFKKILKEAFKLKDEDEDFEPTIELYKKLLAEFNSITAELNAWLYLQRMAAKRGDDISVSMNDYSEDRLFEIHIDHVVQKYSVSDLQGHFPNSSPTTAAEIEYQVKRFVPDERSLIFRGKYLILFLEQFLKRLIQDIGTKDNRKHFKVKKSVSLSLRRVEILLVLTQYADTPRGLRDFLQNLAKSRIRQLKWASTDET